MRRFDLRARLTVILAASLLAALLQGCAPTAADTPPPDYQTPEPEISESTSPPYVTQISQFTLRYNPSKTLNPLTCTDPDNLLISSLMYEGLFVLDGEFNAEPVLCESYETTDNTVYTIKIKPGINMSDGSVLTADDVAYTIGIARNYGQFVNRLRAVERVAAEDKLTVSIELSSPNSRFIKLLDIPVIKYGSIDSAVPAGTGPYTLSSGDPQKLERLQGHRDFAKLPVENIYLRECGMTELVELFADGSISLVWDDPSDISDFRISRMHETRNYNTTHMQYIGFNARTAAMSDPEVRRAIGIAVDRKHIADEIMSGQALAAPLALSPAYNLYSTEWEKTISNPLVEMSAVLAENGLEDANSDSFLEYPTENGFVEFSIDFIVNRENRYKVMAADKIAETMRRVGFDVTVTELAWDEYLTALEEGDFDMYYGEVALTADFNLSPLISSGGRLDYGNMGGSRYDEMLGAFLAAETEAEEKHAAKLLCDEIDSGVPFIPVLYKKHAVHSGKGVVSGASPSQSNVFFGLTSWMIRK